MRRRSGVIIVSFPDGCPETMRHRCVSLNRPAQAADPTRRGAIRRRRLSSTPRCTGQHRHIRTCVAAELIRRCYPNLTARPRVGGGWAALAR